MHLEKPLRRAVLAVIAEEAIKLIAFEFGLDGF